MKIILSNVAAVDIIIPFYKREATIAALSNQLSARYFQVGRKLFPMKARQATVLRLRANLSTWGFGLLNRIIAMSLLQEITVNGKLI
ncbi:MAG: hypothetical protein ACYSUS_00875 [Planctomycetota bacterium]|jgi:hypothetical protein